MIITGVLILSTSIASEVGAQAKCKNYELNEGQKEITTKGANFGVKNIGSQGTVNIQTKDGGIIATLEPGNETGFMGDQ